MRAIAHVAAAGWLTLYTVLGVGVDAQNRPAPYAARRAAAIARLGTDILIVPSRASFAEADQRGFVQAPFFQYLTGLEELVGAVLVLDGSTSAAAVFAADASLAAIQPAQFPEVFPIPELESWLRQRFRERPQVQVYVAASDVRGAVDAPPPMARSVIRWQAWLTTLGAKGVKSATNLLLPLREIKDDAELAILRRVAIASRDAARAGIRAIAPGKWEHDTELAVVNACVAAGARSVSFWPWTLSGPNATFPSMRKSFVAYGRLDRAMQRGEMVRVDVGCQIDHYMGDVGRTVPVSGRFTDGQREAWDVFIAGYRAGLARIKDGAAVTAIFDAALGEIRRRSAALTTIEGRHAAAVLLGPNGKDHWAIHGVGLNDAEGAPETLSASMVVAYEPMFMVDGDAFYLEDMIAVTHDGYELLTPGLPYTAQEIQKVMSNRIP